MEGEEFRSQYAQKPYFYFLSSSKEISKNVIFIDIENIFIEIFCRILFADNIPEHSSCRIFTEFSAFACVIMHRNIWATPIETQLMKPVVELESIG